MPVPSSRAIAIVGAAAFEVLVAAAVEAAEAAEVAVELGEEELEDDDGATYFEGSRVPQFAFSVLVHWVWAAALLALLAMHSL